MNRIRFGILLLILIVAFIAYKSYEEYAMSKTVPVCGKFVGTTTIRGASLVKIEYIYREEKRSMTIYSSLIKKHLTMDSLLKVDCILIECSVTDPDVCELKDQWFLRE